MADLTFNRFRKELLDSTIDLSSQTIKVMLVNASYTPNKDDDFATTATAGEIVRNELYRRVRRVRPQDAGEQDVHD